MYVLGSKVDKGVRIFGRDKKILLKVYEIKGLCVGMVVITRKGIGVEWR